MQRLVNEEIRELKSKVSEYKEAISEATYEQFKSSTVLANTNSLRGKTGDSFREYVNIVHLNLTQKMINVAEEIQQAIEKMESTFLEYESMGSGIVDSTTLDRVVEKIEQSKGDFYELQGRSAFLMSRASEFIATTSLPNFAVTSAYRDSEDEIKGHKDDLEAADTRAKNDLRNVESRVESLEQQLKDLQTVYRGEGGLAYDKIGKITNEKWYSDENTGAFAAKLEDDPFSVDTSKNSFYEDQWVGGINGEYFGSYDHAFLNYESSTVVKDGNTRHEGSASVFELNGYAQATEYAVASASGSVLQVGAHSEIGKDGVDLNAHGNVAKIDGNVIIGTENFNGNVAGNAEFLSGNANFVVKPPDENGDYKLQVGAKGVLWKAEASGGFSLFGLSDPKGSYENTNDGTKEKRSLLGLDGSVSVGKQAGAEVEFSSTTAYENDYFQLNSDRYKIDVALIAGVKIDLQVPSISLKWPF
ncbi:T7SS effector LXG polymorphic toxin [Alkalihalobacillus trypoxylicola]|uniref:LXG domain-containing protein n=1 Tax=Alkalihalobacillus trypoxylicola TaxID=519424 RepID=A0A162CQG7_9BACI|nr:T7SS effector LXG polymorphic toxin [Alkalihalobacillus trypoxylicola]KYG26017.1 hypothetical protein AZF04_13095 [Alkalihalobacillus trypoxylicola]